MTVIKIYDLPLTLHTIARHMGMNERIALDSSETKHSFLKYRTSSTHTETIAVKSVNFAYELQHYRPKHGKQGYVYIMKRVSDDTVHIWKKYTNTQDFIISYRNTVLDRENTEIWQVFEEIVFDKTMWDIKNGQQWKVELLFWLTENFNQTNVVARNKFLKTLSEENLDAYAKEMLPLLLAHYEEFDTPLRDRLISKFFALSINFRMQEYYELIHLAEKIPDETIKAQLSSLKKELHKKEEERKEREREWEARLKAEREAREKEMKQERSLLSREIDAREMVANAKEKHETEKLSSKIKNKISISHPKSLAKGFSSLFVVQIYSSANRHQAVKNINSAFGTQKISEHVDIIKLKTGQKIRLSFSSPVLKFSSAIIKKIDKDISIAHYTVIPQDNCRPGNHYVTLSIQDAETQIEYESISFTVRVVDFAFDHISRPLVSKVASAILGASSLIMFALTALEQVDKTFGLTSGTAAAVLTSTVMINFWSLFKQPKISSSP